MESKTSSKLCKCGHRKTKHNEYLKIPFCKVEDCDCKTFIPVEDDVLSREDAHEVNGISNLPDKDNHKPLSDEDLIGETLREHDKEFGVQEPYHATWLIARAISKERKKTKTSLKRIIENVYCSYCAWSYESKNTKCFHSPTNKHLFVIMLSDIKQEMGSLIE